MIYNSQFKSVETFTIINFWKVVLRWIPCFREELKDIESWAGKVITPGVISEQTVSKPWQSSTWLVVNPNKGPTRFYYFGLPAELFLLRNEIIVAIRKKICTSPSPMVAPQFPRGFEKSDWPTSIQTSYFIGPYYITAVKTVDLYRPRNDPQPWNDPQIDPEMIPS